MEEVKGKLVDTNTRCVHYHSETDIIAIKMHCCQTYYACIFCHDELEDHGKSRWPRNRWDEAAVLCGNCESELSIQNYMKASVCPNCKHAFNAGCRLHYPYYFEMNQD
ncbi:CHY zinc finger protein [Halobacillus sp. ACCC02827]|uniref:CHY zinc finger protein n=1 Tax=Bacillaceae TaxID=186817 RepID=UPI0002A4E709|nr:MULTISPECIES: CHY zinc finger protein [Bacillaceae]ELK46448.1 Zinc finger domain containing protein [Halobacillus sp. BAB-2008]QHT45693.1 hypothetical protein M662_03935 [Bacillus sp. SB49]WJE16492.1 CHY zinc finger protein [Halobacillus sp. ACCC02827]